MKQAYPVILTPGEESVVAYFPDFDAGTEGRDLADAIDMAADAIGLLGITLEDEGRRIPAPTPFSEVHPQAPGDIVTLVSVDFAEYRRRHDNRSVRRNVSLPAWLDEAARQADVNVSAILAGALRAELGIDQRRL